jgi:hypothetical protein
MSYIPFESEVQVVNQVDVLEEPWQLDAYGRLRTSVVTTIFESQLSRTVQNRLWHTVLVGNANTEYLESQSSLNLNVVDIGDKAIRQSKVYTTAKLGKSHLIFLTGNLVATNGITKKIGYFDDDNGAFFRMNENGVLEIVIRSKASGTVQEDIVVKGNWNIDNLDGTGKSEIILNTTYDQVFAFDIEWMGTGKVRAGFMIDGKMVYVHEFKYSNTDNKPYMTTATLPVRYEIENISGSTASLKQTASVVMTEGGPNEFQNGYAVSNEVAPKQISTALTPVMSIRPKKLNNQGLVNRISSILESTEIYSEDDDTYFELQIGTTLDNSFFNDVDADDSSIEFDYSADGCSNGTVIAKGYTKKDGGIKGLDKKRLAKHLLTTNFDGSDSTTLTLLAKTLNNPTADVFATFSWAEDD